MQKNPGPAPRTTVKRLSERGVYDRKIIDRVLDEGLVCQVAMVHDGMPVVIPMAYVRAVDRLFVHGSKASRLLRLLASGAEACINVTLVDGLVLARSAFHHSMNYRSVVLWGRGQPVTDLKEMEHVFHMLMEKLTPGRWDLVRQPTEAELIQTLVVAIPIAEASAKVRTGPPRDDEDDLALAIWAGILPLRMATAAPIADTALSPGIPLPEHLRPFQEKQLEWSGS